MKIHSLFLALLPCLFMACGDNDDDIMPSNSERNWLIVEDNPNDAIDHQRYLIFQETGIPIYYNDTIGEEIRYSSITDETYIHHEILQVFYNPGFTTPAFARYTLVKNRDNLEEALVFLRDEVIPEIPDNAYLPSILLVDTLITPSGDSYVYKGLNTTVVGQMHRFHEMDELEKNNIKGEFLASIIMSILTQNETKWLESEFYGLTYAVNPDRGSDIYSGSNNRYVYNVAGTSLDRHIGALGFIGTKTKPSTTTISKNKLPDDPYHPEMWITPTKEQDIQQYCRAILGLSEAEFMEQYAKAKIYGYDATWIAGQGTVEVANPAKDKNVEFPVVKAKYRVLKEKLKEYGFRFDD